jgi:hypothetical protein
MATCSICGQEYESTEPCPECSKKIHKKLTIACVLECPPNGISKQDGVYILDQITKLFISRGIAPIDIQFLEQYVWLDIQLSKDEVEKLQNEGVFRR